MLLNKLLIFFITFVINNLYLVTMYMVAQYFRYCTISYSTNTYYRLIFIFTWSMQSITKGNNSQFVYGKRAIQIIIIYKTILISVSFFWDQSTNNLCFKIITKISLILKDIFIR